MQPTNSLTKIHIVLSHEEGIVKRVNEIVAIFYVPTISTGFCLSIPGVCVVDLLSIDPLSSVPNWLTLPVIDLRFLHACAQTLSPCLFSVTLFSVFLFFCVCSHVI